MLMQKVCKLSVITTICLLWCFHASLAMDIPLDVAVLLWSRCPDGRIPLNSPQVRCQNQPRLQWAGRRCDNSRDFSCPPGYNCLANGLCCDVPAAPLFNDDLCRLDPSTSNVIDVAGPCTTDTDCKSNVSPRTKCCRGKCVLLMQRCLQKLKEYQNILSTGRMPHQHLPNCTRDGAFAPVQWEPQRNLRWCVDPRTGLARRSGCCMQQPDASTAATAATGWCANPRPCPRDLCAMQSCPARPDARCRINACGDCRAEFVDSVGRVVNCSAGLSQCQAKGQTYYDGLAWLRARDQTQWIQTNLSNTPVSTDAQHVASLDRCQADTCITYNASKLEPAATGFPSGQSCPKQDQLLYRCPDRCSSFSGCDSSRRQVCCNSGCGLECMTPADISPVRECRMSISSGHCPAVGCFRMCRRWGYDRTRRICRPFWYAGSGGNNNRYNSWAECIWHVQNCHGRVLLALPVRPRCLGNGYSNVQVADNAMFWCATSDGRPTPGTLHADILTCDRNGQLVKNKYYQKEAYLYQGRCAGGAWPAWCQDVPVNRTCGTSGVTTFADACDNCRLVHVNADGEEVACQTDATSCAASGATCLAGAAPRYDFSVAKGRCDAVPGPGGLAGPGSCSGAARLGYSRESGCLQACATSWCLNATGPPAFYPDLCVDSPACPVPGAVCVPDECAGRERYYLPNGTEAVDCARQLQPLSVVAIADCGTTTPGATALPATTIGAVGTNTTTSTAAFTALVTTSTTHKSSNHATQPTTITTATTTLAATPSPQPPPAKVIPPICRLRSQFGVEVLRCRSTDGRYEPKQCNATHCFCVVVDSGAPVTKGPVLPLEKASSLVCPVVETTSLSVSITFDNDYAAVLPTMDDEAALQQVIIKKFAHEAGLQPRNIRQVDLEPGSIIVTVDLQKMPNDSSVDLPASSFELKTMALKQTLTLSFNGVTLAPSARQDFNESRVTLESPTDKLISGSSSSGQENLNVAGIVAGVLITVIVVAVTGVIIAFALRRRSLLGEVRLPGESGNYETMSNASGTTAASDLRVYDNFSNQVYGQVEEEVYDNISRPTSSA